MEEIQDAMNNGDLATLAAAGSTYEKCMEVKHMLGNVQIQAQCSGGAAGGGGGAAAPPHNHDNHDHSAVCTLADYMLIMTAGGNCDVGTPCHNALSADCLACHAAVGDSGDDQDCAPSAPAGAICTTNDFALMAATGENFDITTVSADCAACLLGNPDNGEVCMP